MERITNFFTFQSPTFKSVFAEGQRRIALLCSIIFPLIFSYIIMGDGFYAAFPLFYAGYFILILLYIWIMEGQGKVREGGNALKTLRNFILSIVLLGSIAASALYYYENIYLPKAEINELAMRRTLHETLVMRYHTCLIEKNWQCLRELLYDNVNNQTKDEYIKLLMGQTETIEFIKLDENKIVSFTNNNFVVDGRITYTAKYNNENKNHTKTLNTKFTIVDLGEEPKIQKIEIIKTN